MSATAFVSVVLFFLFIGSGSLFATDAGNSPVPDKSPEKKTEVSPHSAQNTPTQEEMVRRHDQRASLKVFSSMNEEAGAGSRGAWDKNLEVAHPTPEYVQSMGEYSNSIAPAYPTVSQEPWIYNPPEDKIPEQLKQAMEGKPIQPTPEQLKQQEFNNGTYVEPQPGPDADVSASTGGNGKPSDAANGSETKRSSSTSANGKQDATGGSPASGNSQATSPTAPSAAPAPASASAPGETIQASPPPPPVSKKAR